MRGLAASEASLATNLEGATPTEHVRRSWSRTAALILAPIVGPSPWSRRAPVTSRNASSREMASTSGVNDVKIAITRWLISP